MLLVDSAGEADFSSAVYSVMKPLCNHVPVNSYKHEANGHKTKRQECEKGTCRDGGGGANRSEGDKKRSKATVNRITTHIYTCIYIYMIKTINEQS